MAHRFAELAFTPDVKAVQTQEGSRGAYARFEAEAPPHDRLGPDESRFIATRDHFFMATVSQTGWPYVQHRGGPAGFLRVLDERTIGFADLRGNRQYVSVGNLGRDDRVCLILMDWAQRRRLKLLGHARLVDVASDAALVAKLQVSDYPGRVERGFVIAVEAFDWNCPQHITPRFTEEEVEAMTAPLRARVAELEAALRRG